MADNEAKHPIDGEFGRYTVDDAEVGQAKYSLDGEFTGPMGIPVTGPTPPTPVTVNYATIRRRRIGV